LKELIEMACKHQKLTSKTTIMMRAAGSPVKSIFTATFTFNLTACAPFSFIFFSFLHVGLRASLHNISVTTQLHTHNSCQKNKFLAKQLDLERLYGHGE